MSTARAASQRPRAPPSHRSGLLEIASAATLLLIGVREASGPHPMGARSSASSLSVIDILFVHLTVVNPGVVVPSTWMSMCDLRLAQPNKKK